MSIAVYGLTAREELRQAIAEAEQLSALSKLNGQQKNRFDYLLSKISATKAVISAEEERSRNTGSERQREVRKQQDLMRNFFLTGDAGEYRAMVEGTDSAGGFLVAPDFSFSQQVEQGLKAFDAIFDMADVDTSDNLRAKTLPCADFTAYSEVAVQEGVAVPLSTPMLSKITLGNPSAFYRGNAAAVSFELFQDSYESVEELLKQIFTLSSARGVGRDLINGSTTAAAAMPGLLNQAPVKYTTPTGQTTQVKFADLLALYQSIDRVYRVQTGTGWLMNDQTYLAIRGLTDSTGRPALLIDSDSDRELLLGHPIGISNSMPTMAATKAVIAFGWLKAFKVRRTPYVLKVRRQVSGYVELGQALVNLQSRWASSLLAPTTASPIGLLKMAAS